MYNKLINYKNSNDNTVIHYTRGLCEVLLLLILLLTK